jgi:hypothetical protein
MKSPKRKKSFVFHSEVKLRFYEQTLGGDHPNTSYGPPISLDWKYEEAEPIDFDEYEEEGRGQRRSMKQMMLNHYIRKNIPMKHATDTRKTKSRRQARHWKRPTSFSSEVLLPDPFCEHPRWKTWRRAQEEK